MSCATSWRNPCHGGLPCLRSVPALAAVDRGGRLPLALNSQWCWSGDGVAHYPLRFKRLVVTMPEKILYGTRYVPPRSYEIQLRDLVALHEPVEKVLAGE